MNKKEWWWGHKIKELVIQQYKEKINSYWLQKNNKKYRQIR